MAGKKERFEVLLEAIQSDVKAIAEGQSGLQRQIDDLAEGQSGLRQQLEEVKIELKTEIRAVDKKHDTNFQALYDLLQDTRNDVRGIKENLQRVETKLDITLNNQPTLNNA